MKSEIIEQDIEGIIQEFKSLLFNLRGKTVLITGGNGFIPSYLVDIIATFSNKMDNSCNLIIINRNPITESSRLSHLIGTKNIKFLALDVGKPFIIEEKVDIIIHAASRANPTSFLDDPLDTIDSNVNGLRNLLEYARNNDVENFIFFSSAEIYGNPPEGMTSIAESFTGNVDTLSKRACYSESKRFCETLCSVYYRKYKVPVKIIRIFHTYGPGLRDDGKAITDFFNSAKNKEKIVLRDRGESKIAFIYISDLIKGILLILFKGVNGEVYNAGDDRQVVSIRELAEKIAYLYGNIPVEITENGCFRDNYRIDIRKPDISKLRALGFQPEVDLETGLRRMYDSFNEK